MKIRPRSIRAKLLLVFLGASTLPIAVLGFIFYRSSTRAVDEMVGNRAAGIARAVRAELDQRLSLRIEDRLLVANELLHDRLSNLRLLVSLYALVAFSFFTFSLPVASLVIFTVAAMIAGILAAIAPARRASRLNVLEALQYE